MRYQNQPVPDSTALDIHRPYQILTVEEVAAILRLPVKTVRQKRWPSCPAFDRSFPAPIRLSKRSLGWFSNEINEWLQSRPRAIVVGGAA